MNFKKFLLFIVFSFGLLNPTIRVEYLGDYFYIEVIRSNLMSTVKLTKNPFDSPFETDFLDSMHDPFFQAIENRKDHTIIRLDSNRHVNLQTALECIRIALKSNKAKGSYTTDEYLKMAFFFFESFPELLIVSEVRDFLLEQFDTHFDPNTVDLNLVLYLNGIYDQTKLNYAEFQAKVISKIKVEAV